MSARGKRLNNVSIIGCGDIGCQVAEKLIALPHFNAAAITGYARNSASLSRIAQLGVVAAALDLDNLQPNSAAKLGQFHKQLIFYFAPPPNKGKIDSRFRAWLAMLDPSRLPQRILYISTTGVYGNQQGRTVTELTPTKPQAERAKRRLDAEQALSQFAQQHGIEFVILRVASIYSLRRLPRQRIENKIPILRADLAPITNHIHEDDLVQVCVTAALQSNSGEIYNVCDNDNMSMSDYFISVANYLNLAQPPAINWQQAETVLSKGMLSYLKESRLIDNAKLLNNLHINLKYPSLSDFFNL